MTIIKLFILLTLYCITIFAAPDFSIMGFATIEGGTTGGKGGAVVTPSTLAELKKYAEDKTTPYIIRITKEFTTGKSVKVGKDGKVGGTINSTYGDIIRLGSNKTLIGIGSSAFFNRIGIIIQCQSNIIIRNIKFTMKDVPVEKSGENKILGWEGKEVVLTDPDCIGIQADAESVPKNKRKSTHIWIDHCEFFNEDPATVYHKDRYDGLVDGKNNSTCITISWCYFHDHSKASLMGKGNSDNFDRKITYSHNHFDNISSRLPLVRFGKIHLLNNYMTNTDNGANARINSDLYVEGNHFEHSKKPIFGKTSEKGAATFVKNRWVDCSALPQKVISSGISGKPLNAKEELLSGSFKPSSAYSYKADDVSNVASIVSSNAGVGKISTDDISTSIYSSLVPAYKQQLAVMIKNGKVVVSNVPGTAVTLYNALGAKVFSGSVSSAGSLSIPVKKGFFILKAGLSSQKVIVQ